MTITLKQVKNLLSPDEPDYDKAAKIGQEALPHLKKIIKGKNAMMASKAAYLACMIQSKKTIDVISIAAKSLDPIVRVSVAGGSINLHVKGVEKILQSLLKDKDESVRNKAKKTMKDKEKNI